MISIGKRRHIGDNVKLEVDSRPVAAEEKRQRAVRAGVTVPV